MHRRSALTVPRALAVLATALALAGPPGRAQPAAGASCQSYARGDAAAPELVRRWLEHSGDEHVLVCLPPAPAAAGEATPVYFGESALQRRGAVCSYSSHGLTRAGTAAAGHLERYERGETLAMALAGADCPAHAPGAAPAPYVATYDVSPGAFVAIMQLWAAAADSVQALDRASRAAKGAAESGAAPTPATRARLRTAIEAGAMRTAGVTRIVRMSGRGLRHRYALFVADPDSQPAGATLYVIYLSKSLTGPYRITGVADTAD